MSIYNSYEKFGNINKLKSLGKGTFGIVYYDKNIVYKQYKIGNGYGIPYDTLREIFTYFYLNKILNSPIPNFYGVVLNRNEGGIIIEKFSTTLYKLDKIYIDKYFIDIAKQLIFYLCTYSLYGFVHRDIKPNNILFDIINDKPIIKIIDWGSARYKRFYISDLDISNDVCTLFTRSPEVIINKLTSATGNYDSTFHDIWSCAVSLVYIWDSDNYLFNGEKDEEQLNIISSILKKSVYSDAENNTIKNINNPLLIDLLDKMIVYNPDERINIEEIIEHPFMADYKEKILENIRESKYKKINLTEGHCSEIRKTNIEWLIHLVKGLEDLEFQMPILLAIFIMDEIIVIAKKHKILINKALYLSAYLLSAELLKPKSVNIESYSKKTGFLVEDLIDKQILIINKIPYLYDIIANSDVIDVLDIINTVDIIKIALILIIYYPNLYYSSNNNIEELIIDIYNGKKKLKEFKPLFNYKVDIVN